MTPPDALCWDFRLRHQDRFLNNPRIDIAVRQAANLSPAEKAAVRKKAQKLQAGIEKSIPYL